MKTIEFEIVQTKVAEHKTSVPDEIIEQGEDNIKDWLEVNGHIDRALDYAEVNQTTNLYID